MTSWLESYGQALIVFVVIVLLAFLEWLTPKHPRRPFDWERD